MAPNKSHLWAPVKQECAINQEIKNSKFAVKFKRIIED